MPWHEPYPWAVAIAFCATLAVWGKHPQRMAVHYIFKPLTTGLIFVVAWLMVDPGPARPWILWALALSGVGDVVLMLRQKWFVYGLLAFLFALVSYAVAFTVENPITPRQLLYALLPLAVSVAVLRWLWPHLGRLRLPVTLYVAVMATMVWRAISRFDALDVPLDNWVYGCLGAAFFMTGDTLLARRRFAGQHVRYSVELGVYFLAQWCLVAAAR